jgi:hypothetical protein
VCTIYKEETTSKRLSCTFIFTRSTVHDNLSFAETAARHTTYISSAQLTAAGIVILLSTQNRAAIVASGSSLQAFFYDAQLEEWVRVADGQFYLSDFYVGHSSSSVNRDGTTKR